MACQNPRETCSAPQTFTGHPGAGRGATVILEKRQEGDSTGGRGFVWLVCECGLCLNRRRRQWGEVGTGVSGYMQPPSQPLQIQKVVSWPWRPPFLTSVLCSPVIAGKKILLFLCAQYFSSCYQMCGDSPHTNQFSSSLWVPSGCPTIHPDTSYLRCQIPQ